MQTEEISNTRETVEEFYRRLGSGDTDGVVGLFAESVDWNIPGAEEIPWTGRRSTREEVREFFESFPDHLQAGVFDLSKLIVDGDDAVALGHFEQTVRKTGQTFASAFAFRFTVEEGRIVRYHVYEDSYALALAYFGEV